MLDRQKAFSLAPCLPNFGHRGLEDSRPPPFSLSLHSLASPPPPPPALSLSYRRVGHARGAFAIQSVRPSGTIGRLTQRPLRAFLHHAMARAGPIGALCVRTTPEADATNGFFVARFVRKHSGTQRAKAVRRHPYCVAPFGPFRSHFMRRTLWVRSRCAQHA